jgi:hypothetical protein
MIEVVLSGVMGWSVVKVYVVAEVIKYTLL